MPFHIAPLIREMEQVRENLGNIQNMDSVGYTERSAAETAGTYPTPSVTAAGGIGNFWLYNQRSTPVL